MAPPPTRLPVADSRLRRFLRALGEARIALANFAKALFLFCFCFFLFFFIRRHVGLKRREISYLPTTRIKQHSITASTRTSRRGATNLVWWCSKHQFPLVSVLRYLGVSGRASRGYLRTNHRLPQGAWALQVQ